MKKILIYCVALECDNLIPKRYLKNFVIEEYSKTVGCVYVLVSEKEFDLLKILNKIYFNNSYKEWAYDYSNIENNRMHSMKVCIRYINKCLINLRNY